MSTIVQQVVQSLTNISNNVSITDTPIADASNPYNGYYLIHIISAIYNQLPPTINGSSVNSLLQQLMTNSVYQALPSANINCLTTAGSYNVLITHVKTKNFNTNFVNFVLSSGIDISSKDANGRNVIHWMLSEQMISGYTLLYSINQSIFFVPDPLQNNQSIINLAINTGTLQSLVQTLIAADTSLISNIRGYISSAIGVSNLDVLSYTLMKYGSANFGSINSASATGSSLLNEYVNKGLSWVPLFNAFPSATYLTANISSFPQGTSTTNVLDTKTNDISTGLPPFLNAISAGQIQNGLSLASYDNTVIANVSSIGQNAIHIYVNNRNITTTQNGLGQLVLLGVCINKFDNNGISPLMLSIQNSDFTTFNSLLQLTNSVTYGAKVINLNAQNTLVGVPTAGDAALHTAVRMKQIALIQILLNQSGINKTITNTAGLTPQTLAQSLGGTYSNLVALFN